MPAGWLAKSADGVLSASGTGMTGEPPVWLGCGDGSALCAMSVRNGVSKCSTLTGTGTGMAMLPSTRPVVVTYCGSPFGPGLNLPYGSTASIGMFVTSVSTSARPSRLAACCLTAFQVPIPVRPSGDPA